MAESSDDQREDELAAELEDLEVGDDADKVTGGTNDPCEGGQRTQGK